ncbi:putative phospholipid-transporting ATPase IIB [Cucumispora dikerogammari]|nr:putative phospholipid-transporting ATPase IIB [Cucumispora dikerogammari]
MDQQTIIYKEIKVSYPNKTSPPNLINNQKYNLVTFLPKIFYAQISQFFDFLIFALMILSTIPTYSIQPLASSITPWIMIMVLVCYKEGTQDYSRYVKDLQINTQLYTIFRTVGVKGEEEIKKMIIKSSEIQTGDLIFITKNSRIPADLVLLKSFRGREVFIRTDQLDGETDWKLRIPPSATQDCDFEFFDAEVHLISQRNLKKISNIGSSKVDIVIQDTNIPLHDAPVEIKEELPGVDDFRIEDIHNTGEKKNINTDFEDDKNGMPLILVSYEKPHKDIYSFNGTLSVNNDKLPLSVENTLWRDTVLASSTILGTVIYTGSETKTSLNTSQPRNKLGKIDYEINYYTVFLFIFALAMSSIFTLFNFIFAAGRLDVVLIKFFMIFSNLIPISLKCTIDFSRMFFYTRSIHEDIKGSVVRNPNISEELGRISYLLSDKTGTLTQNIMLMRKLHLGNICYSVDLNSDIRKIIRKEFIKDVTRNKSFSKGQNLSERLLNLVNALSVCHNVTPVIEEDGKISFQASSPDEVAILEWCLDVGVKLIKRSRNEMIVDYSNLINDISIYEHNGISNPMLSLSQPNILSKSSNLNVPLNKEQLEKKLEILEIFPFTSESKRMGIIVKINNEYYFYLKGADMIMQQVIVKSDWLNEEVDFMAREGLRTLVIAMKKLSEIEYLTFEQKMKKAKLSPNRNVKVLEVQSSLEKDMILLGVTGVEDKLQEDVMLTLELLKNAGIKTWILTGDKIETAISIAQSTRLFLNRNYKILQANNRAEALRELEFLRNSDLRYIVLDGKTLSVFQQECFKEFILLSSRMEAVVACRCTPTQKAEVTQSLKEITGKLSCSIGDGGNDVSMITAANMGIGIVGKEGNQASLASDISILRFADISSLILWHGRNSYSSTSRICHYIIHRGSLLSIVQAIFASLNRFLPFNLIHGFLALSFICIYTACPMFALVDYKKISKNTCFRYPELYKELKMHKELSFMNFFKWFLISFYQASILMGLSFFFFKNELHALTTIVFSSMVINEFITVFLIVGLYSKRVIYAEMFSFFLFIATFFCIPSTLILPSGVVGKFYFASKVLGINICAAIFLLLSVLYEKWGNREDYLKIVD